LIWSVEKAKPSMMSGALSPYILWMALRCTTSEEPPSVLSKRNLACSSADMRDNFRCTVSRTLMVARLVSRTTSNCGRETTAVLISIVVSVQCIPNYL
uniref:Uncharacterized protein n=1 Tax=Sander lucioperca TaxID=283035 RepID=A0A8D0DBZ8_SANLU